ncbi:MAG: hypothetical protein AAF560_05460 [Acidobacteriota bacterium]
MSDQNEREIPILLKGGCAQPLTSIGKASGTLRFQFDPPGGGIVKDIEGLDEAPFSNKRSSDKEFLVDYAGFVTDRRWTYLPVTSPICEKEEGDDEDPELTNEPQL